MGHTSVVLGIPPTQLELRPIGHGRIEATLRSTGLDASLVIHDLSGAGTFGDLNALVGAFEQLVEDWSTRIGQREHVWHSEDHELTFSVLSDQVGHISLLTEMAEPLQEGWRTQVEIMLEAGALPRHAQDIKALIEGLSTLSPEQ